MACSSSDDSNLSEEHIVSDGTNESSQKSNLTILSFDEEIYSPHEKSSISHTGEFSFEQRRLPSEEKVAEYKMLMNKVNEAYINWKANEFVLNTIQTKSSAWVQQIEAIIKASEIRQKVCMKRDGETCNLLGLEEEDLKSFSSKSLMSFNRAAFRDHATEVVRMNISKLKLQKKSLQDKFGAHSIKTVAGVISKEKEEQLHLYRNLDDQQTYALQVLNNNHMMANQLTTLRQTSSCDLGRVTFALLQTKAMHLQIVTSTLKESLNQNPTDKKMKKAMDVLGDRLKMNVSEKGEELKALQKKLIEYNRKETTSEKYKELVKTYAKLKMQLQHKHQTLNILKDPNF